MTYETSEQIFKTLVKIEIFDNMLWFGSLLIWLVVFYVLHHLFKLKFLKLLLISEVFGIVLWFWTNRYYFIGMPNGDTYNVSSETTIAIVDMCLRLIPLLLGTIGAAMGLKYLQKLWKEKQIASQRVDPTSADEQSIVPEG